MIKVVFIGGLTNGKIVYNYLVKNKFVDLLMTITYPDTVDKPRFVKFPNNSKIIKSEKANDKLNIIKQLKPDYIFVAGWSELLTNEILNVPVKGTIGFHPSKLPNDRGRSVLAWQIEDGYSETALSMFYYNEIPDEGDIIASEPIKIEVNDYINDVLDKVDAATYNLMYAYFPLLRNDRAPRKKQNLNEGNFRRLRKEIDSIIDWNKNSNAIYNKIRAISRPYPGARGLIDKIQYTVWESEVVDTFPFGENEAPGTLIAKLYDNSLIVKTRDSFLRVLKYE